MKVLEISTCPLQSNGQALFAVRFTERMKEVQADYLSFGESDPALRARIAGEVFTAPHRLRHPLRYILFVRDTVRRGGYTVVHIHGNSCTVAIDLLGAKLGGAKVRITHSHNSRGKYPILHRLLRPLFELLVTDRFACGREAGTWMYGKKPFTVVPNAVDTVMYAYDAETRARVRGEMGIADDTLVCGTVSRFAPEKNHSFLLDVFASVRLERPDCILLLAGEGDLLDAMKQRANALGLGDSVRFLGQRSDIPALLQAMDVMLLPSLYEGFPTVALEWQCAGLTTFLSENITPDCVLTDFTRRIPLRAPEWIDAVLNASTAAREKNASEGQRSLEEKGYRLETEAEKIERKYIELARKAETQE